MAIPTMPSRLDIITLSLFFSLLSISCPSVFQLSFIVLQYSRKSDGENIIQIVFVIEIITLQEYNAIGLIFAILYYDTSDRYIK